MSAIIEEIPDITGSVQYHILGDSAFPLSPSLLKPFPHQVVMNDEQKRLFNYNLSIVRMLIEQTFGSLKMRLRCLLKALEFREVSNDVLIISACVHLHNYLISVDDACEVTSDAEYEELIRKYPKKSTTVFCDERAADVAVKKRDFYVRYFN